MQSDNSGQSPPRARPRRRFAVAAFALTLLVLTILYAAMVLANSRTALDVSLRPTAAQGELQIAAAAELVLGRCHTLSEAGDELRLIPSARRFRAPFLCAGAKGAVGAALSALGASANRPAFVEIGEAMSAAAPISENDLLTRLRKANAESPTQAVDRGALLAAVARAAAKDLRQLAADMRSQGKESWPRSALEADALRARARGAAWAWLVLWRGAVADGARRDQAEESGYAGPEESLTEVASDDPGVLILLRQEQHFAADKLAAAADELDALAEVVELSPKG